MKHTHLIPKAGWFAHVAGCPACEDANIKFDAVKSDVRRRMREAGYPDGCLPGTSIPRFTAANRAYVKACNRCLTLP